MYYATLTVDVARRHVPPSSSAAAAAAAPPAPPPQSVVMKIVALCRVAEPEASLASDFSALHVPLHVAAFGVCCPWIEYDLVFETLDRLLAHHGAVLLPEARVGGAVWLLRCGLPRSMLLANDNNNDAYGVTRAQVQSCYAQLARAYDKRKNGDRSKSRIVGVHGIAVPDTDTDKRGRFRTLLHAHRYFVTSAALPRESRESREQAWTLYGHGAVQHVYYPPDVYHLAPFFALDALIDTEVNNAALMQIIGDASEAWRACFGHAFVDATNELPRSYADALLRFTAADVARRALLGDQWPYATREALRAQVLGTLADFASLSAFTKDVLSSASSSDGDGAAKLDAAAREWRRLLTHRDVPWPCPAASSFLLEHGVVVVQATASGGCMTTAWRDDVRTVESFIGRTRPWQLYHAVGPQYAQAVPLIDGLESFRRVVVVSATHETARRFRNATNDMPVSAIVYLGVGPLRVHHFSADGRIRPVEATSLFDDDDDSAAAAAAGAASAAAAGDDDEDERHGTLLVLDAAHVMSLKHAAALLRAIGDRCDRVVCIGDALLARTLDIADGRFMARVLDAHGVRTLAAVTPLAAPTERLSVAQFVPGSFVSQRHTQPGVCPRHNAAWLRAQLYHALLVIEGREAHGVPTSLASMPLMADLLMWTAEVSAVRVVRKYAKEASDAQIVLAGLKADDIAHEMWQPEAASAQFEWQRNRHVLQPARAGDLVYVQGRCSLATLVGVRDFPGTAYAADFVAGAVPPRPMRQFRLRPPGTNEQTCPADTLPWLHRNLLPTRTPLPTTRRHVPFAGTATHALYVVLGDDATLADVYAAAQSAQQSVLLVVRGERPREAVERLLMRWAAAVDAVAEPGHGAADHGMLDDDGDDVEMADAPVVDEESNV